MPEPINERLCHDVCTTTSRAGWGLREMVHRTKGRRHFVFRAPGLPDDLALVAGAPSACRQTALTSACRAAAAHLV